MKTNSDPRPVSFLKTLLCGTSLLFVAHTSLPADTITIVNPGFEDNFTDSSETTPMVFNANAGTVGLGTTHYFNSVTPTTPSSVAYVPGWVGTNPGYAYVGIQNAVSHYTTPVDDVTFMQVGVENLSQTLTATLQASSIYTLSFQVGSQNNGTYAAPSAVNLLAGSTDLTPVLALEPTPTAGTFATWTFVYDTSASPTGLGDPLKISIDANVGDGKQVNLDNFSLDIEPASTPEPSSIALLLLGGASMVVLTLRKRHHAKFQS